MGKKVKGPHEDLTYRIIGAAMAVHRRIGPGEKEAIYQPALEEAFAQEGLNFEAEKNIPVYDGDQLLGFYIPDFIVEGKVIVEIKAFAALHQKYLGQVITYVNHTGLPIGLLVNFGERSLRWRRVFPSPQATQFHHDYQWMFVPGWLKAQRHGDTTDASGQSVYPWGQSVWGGCPTRIMSRIHGLGTSWHRECVYLWGQSVLGGSGARRRSGMGTVRSRTRRLV